MAYFSTIGARSTSAGGRDGGEEEARDSRWEPEFVDGILSWASYVRLHAPSRDTFAWLYSPLLLDALGQDNAPRFERPDGWAALAGAYRLALADAHARVVNRAEWNGFYLCPRSGRRLQGRHSLQSAQRGATGDSGLQYIEAPEQERLLGVLQVTAARLVQFAMTEAAHDPDVQVARPAPAPLPTPATLAEETAAFYL